MKVSFEPFPKIYESFRRFPENLKKIIKTSGKHIELFPNFSKTFINRLSSSRTSFKRFPKFSEIRGDFRALPKISMKFLGKG